MRIQVDIDSDGVKWVDVLKEKTGLKTHKDLFNNSLTLLNWAVEQREAGRIIASLDEKSRDYKELQMPALEHTVAKIGYRALRGETVPAEPKYAEGEPARGGLLGR